MFGMDSLNEDISNAYIIFGSYSNVEDRLEWQKSLATFINEKLKQGTPVLGICFGHQLMADFYGAKIVRNKNSDEYQGIRKLKFKNKEVTFFVAHSFQVQDLPSSLVTLASTKECSNEIIKHRELPFIGIQGHPEASQYFLDTTLKDTALTNMEVHTASSDGMKFIENFLNEYSLL